MVSGSGVIGSRGSSFVSDAASEEVRQQASVGGVTYVREFTGGKIMQQNIEPSGFAYKRSSRRAFLQWSAIATVGTVLAACAPKVVKETVIVEK